MDKGTLVRTVLLVVAWINQILVSKGYETLPVVGEEEIALVLTLVMSVITWWKNNYVSKKGKIQKQVLERNQAL